MYNLDIKTLRVLHTLMNCGSVTRSAAYLDVTPGAISYFLNKARKSTGSALFFRTKNGMQPDNIGRALAERYQQITDSKIINTEKVSLSNRGLTISTYALIELLIGIDINNVVSKQKTTFYSLPDDDYERQRKIRNKEVDIDIGTRLALDSNIIQSRLFSCGVKIVTSKQYPSSNSYFTLNEWLKATHIVWGRGMPLFHDDHVHTNTFHEYNSKKQVVCIASNSINMILMAAYSKNIVIMPEVIINKLKDRFPVKVFSPPPQINMLYECFVHYHRTLSEDKVIQEFLANLHQMFR